MSGRTFAALVLTVAAAGCAREPAAVAAEGEDTGGAASVAALVSTSSALPSSLDVAGRGLGHAIASSADGAIVVVGAPQDSAIDTSTGAAHVFERVGASWVERAVLRGSLAQALDQFGSHVAVSADGSRIAVGAPSGGPTDSGAVYVFTRVAGVWTEEALLVPGGADSGDDISPVALDRTGETLLVGSPNDSTTTCTGCGAAFVFTRSGTAWTESATLLAATPAPFEKLGWSVAMSDDGTRAIVGIPREDTFVVDAGGAALFTRSGSAWSYETLLSHGDARANDLCGLAVAASAAGDRVAVGCPLDDASGGLNVGSVRVFELAGGTWSSDVALLAHAVGDGDQLGFSVALTPSGDRIAAGAPGDHLDASTAAGTLRLFDRAGSVWGEGGSARPTPTADDAFGRSVAIASDGVTVFGGGDGADTAGGMDAGAAWALTVSAERGEPCARDAFCASGFCVDGVCCDTVCGGDAPDDCQACSAALTGGANGTCGTLSATEAARTVCRPSAGDCDVEEICTAASTECPTEVVLAAGTSCRAAVGPCDVAELCDGSSAACPLDLIAAAGATCRDAAGPCDVAELCSGTETTCPRDGYQPEATDCNDGDVCNGSEHCTLGDCVVFALLDCDDGDACTADACDATDGCSHAAIEGCCLFDFDCIDPDSCTEDTCDGATHTCVHTMIDECMPTDAGPVELPDTGIARPDAGTSAGGDASSSTDGGTASPDAASSGGTAGGGCGCRAQRAGSPSSGLALLALGLVLALSRRRRTY